MQDLCKYLKATCKLSQAKVKRTAQTLESYYSRRKNFDIIIKNDEGGGKEVIIVAEKTPSPNVIDVQ
jgi:hypothetical protein